MDDEEFTLLLHKLPLLLKKNKDEFYQCIEILKQNICIMSDCQMLNFFYTCFCFNMARLWLGVLKEIFPKLSSIHHKIDILKFAALHSTTNFHIEIVKTLAEDTFLAIKNHPKKDDLAYEICFLNYKFFKPILHSQLTTIKTMDRDLSLFFIGKCLSLISSSDIQLKCLEKIKSFRELVPEEITLLFSLNRPEFSGRILDICLRSDNSELLKMAYETLAIDANLPLHETQNAVHFFEIKPDVLKEISQVSLDNLIVELEEFLNMAKIVTADMDAIYYIANLMMSSIFKYKGVSFEQMFLYLWRPLSFEEKKAVIEDISEHTYDSSICCYGIVINLFIYVGALKNTEYLQLNCEIILKQKAIIEMKNLFPPTDDIWTDSTLVEQKLSEILQNISHH